MQRAERFGNRNEIAWTGLNCFIVTNNLLMKIIGVVFAFVTIILQASNQAKLDAARKKACNYDEIHVNST